MTGLGAVTFKLPVRKLERIKKLIDDERMRKKQRHFPGRDINIYQNREII